MTGSPDDLPGAPEVPGAPGPFDGGGGDPLEPLLRPAPGFLAAPPGTFARIRRRAARRRRVRAAAGATAAVAVVAGAVYAAGALTPDGRDQVVGPPASTVTASVSPAPDRPSPSPDAAPTSAPTATGRATEGGATATASPTAPATTPVPSDTAGSAGTGGTGTPMCATSQLTASLGGQDAGAGNLYRYLVLTNHSATACHLNGYPGVSLLDSAGRQIGDPATRRPMDRTTVVLRPGAFASDTIHTANRQGTCLPTSTAVRVYPPGNRASLVVAGQITVCEGMFEITPLLAGTTGNPAS